MTRRLKGQVEVGWEWRKEASRQGGSSSMDRRPTDRGRGHRVVVRPKEKGRKGKVGKVEDSVRGLRNKHTESFCSRPVLDPVYSAPSVCPLFCLCCPSLANVTIQSPSTPSATTACLFHSSHPLNPSRIYVYLACERV